MEQKNLASIIDHFDVNTYEDLYYFLLKNTDDFSSSRRLTHIDGRIIENPPERFYQTAETFILNYYPYSIYKNFSLDKLDLSELKCLVELYFSKRSYDLWLPVDGTIIYAIGNYDSRKLGISDEELLEHYISALGPAMPSRFEIGIGNINTLIQSSSFSEELIRGFVSQNDTGICINLSDEKICATRFVAEREFDGVLTNSDVIFQPIIKKILDADDKLIEFNQLISEDTPENILEDFLYTYHELIFGDKYDTLSTQVWLNFPEYDIGHKSRRLDIVMRNSISKDWEIFELKRASVKLTKTKTDVPMLASAVNNAITQLRNYKNILNRDTVKRAFAAAGIEYYNPAFNLVIGKRPNLPQHQWDWLLSQHEDLNILTYGDLFDSAKSRLNTMIDAIKVN